MEPKINTSINLEWFDISLRNEQLDIFAKGSKIPVMTFDLNNGHITILHRKGDYFYANSPSISVTPDPVEIKFMFSVVLRNETEHYKSIGAINTA